jgi:hypothetical protein
MLAPIVGSIVAFAMAAYSWYKFEQMSDHSARDPIKQIQRQWGIAIPPIRNPGALHLLLRWFRSIGIFSVVLGAVGIIQLWFWPSVCAFYLGLLFLSCDLYLENFNRYVKSCIATVIFGLAGAFSIFVVMRKAPLFSDFMIRGDQVSFVLRNDSPQDDDYRSVDITIWPDGDNGLLYISASRQTNGYEAQIVASAPDHINGRRQNCPPEGAFIYSTGTGYVMLPNTLRIRSEVLPKGAYIEITALITQGASGGRLLFPLKPVTKLQKVLLDGTFYGRFRQFHIHQFATLR